MTLTGNFTHDDTGSFVTIYPENSCVNSEVVTILKKDEFTCSMSYTNYAVSQLIHEALSYESKGHRFNKSKSSKWDGKVRFFNLKNKEFPIGFYKLVVKTLLGNGFTVMLSKAIKSIKYIKSNDELAAVIKSWPLTKTIRDYQVEGLVELINRNRAIVLSITSSGKSFIIYAVFRYIISQINPKAKILLIVPYGHLVDQMMHDFESYENDNFISSRVSGLRQGLKFENSQILVSTYQSIEEMDSKVRAGLLSQYSALCVDEVHISGFDKFIKKCVNLKFRFGVTGTIHEIKESLFRLYQYFGDVYELTDYKSMSQAGFVVDVNVNAVKLNYDTAAVSRYKSSFRHFMAETAEDKFSPNKFYNFEHNFIAAAGYKTKFACDLALALASKGHNVFLLFQTDTEYLLEVNRELNKFVDVKLAYGPTPIHEREAIVQQLESSNGNIVTCSVVFSTGTNILNLHDVILMRIGKSKNFTLQSIGRGMRTCEGKDCVNVWDIVDVLPPMKSAEEAECYSVEHYNKRLHFYKAQGYNIKNIEVQLPSYDVGNYIN